jgi:hypothetical protein
VSFACWFLGGEKPEEHVALVGFVHSDEASIALQVRVHSLNSSSISNSVLGPDPDSEYMKEKRPL